MILKRYMTLSSLSYKLVIFILLPVFYLAFMAYNMTYNGDLPIGMVLAIVVYSGIPIIELWMDNFLFNGVTNKGQMEIIKTAYKGIDLLSDGLIADKIRRFLELFLMTSLSQYTGFVAKEDIHIPLILFYLMETILQCIIMEGFLLISRPIGNPMIFVVIAMAVYVVSLIAQVPLIITAQFRLEYLAFVLVVIGGIVMAICSQRYAMRRIRAGRYD